MSDVQTRWDIEQALTRIWRDALDVDVVARDDDFFTLGGDSVAATKVVTAIEETLGRKIPMSALVDNPTIGLLAARIDSQFDDDDSRTLVPVRTSGARPPLFLVHGLMGHVVFAHVLAKFLGDDQPLYAIRARGFDGQPPHRTIDEMASGYLALIRSVQPRGPYFIGGYCSGSFIALEIGRKLLAAGEKIGLMLAIDPLEPARSFTHWRLGLGPMKSGDELAEVFRANLRQRLESEVYGRGGIGEQRLEWAINVAAALDVAVAQHSPAPFPSPITIIASAERAQSIANPANPWRKIAAQEMRLCTIGQRHRELFIEHGEKVAAMIRKAMDAS